MKVIFVYNPKSGSALEKRELRKKCQTANIHIEAFIAIGDGFEKKLATYIARGKFIAVLGGDGTISTVAGYTTSTKATLIPLPGGTLNHFTRDLGIPQDIDEALARLSTLKPRTIDIASVNGTHFINNSSIGLYPASLRSRQEIESKIGKWPAAVAASWRTLIRFKTYRITIDATTFHTPFIFVGNNRYTLSQPGGTERTRLDDGILTVYIAKTQSRLVLLKIALFALIGRTKQLDEFSEYHPSSITIQANKSMISVSHDGEFSRLSTPLQYTLHPKKLTILG